MTISLDKNFKIWIKYISKILKHQKQVKIIRNYKVTSEVKIRIQKGKKAHTTYYALRIIANPENQYLSFSNIARNIETKIKIRQPHKGISSPELDLRWSQTTKKQRYYFPTKVPIVKTMFFSSSHVWVWEWTIKKAECWRADAFDCDVGEDSWVPWTARSNQSILKGNQLWIFIGRTDAETEAPILWPPDEKSPLIRKDPDAGKDWRQEKGMTEDQTVGWHHWFNGHEFEQALRDGEGQENLASCSPWGRKELDMTEWLNNRLGVTPGTWQKKIQSLYIQWDTTN